MANDRDNEQFGKQGDEKKFDEKKQQPAGEQNQQPEFGQQGRQGQQPTGQPGQSGEFGQQGQSSSGQADLGRGGDTDTLSGERGLGQGASGGQSGEPGGTGGSQSGFIGSQGTGADAHLKEEGATTGGSDFAPDGQGAPDNPDEDIETGQRRNRDSEGGSGDI